MSLMATAQIRRATLPNDAVLRVHAAGKEEREVLGKVIDVHAAGQVVLHIGEAVGKGKGQLADGIRPGLGDMVAADIDTE